MEDNLNKKRHQLNHNKNTTPSPPSPRVAPSHVSLHVQRQVIRPGEGALAQVALEGPVSRVFAEVTGQLVGPGELPPAAFPAAVVRLLTCEDRGKRHG